MRCDTCKQESAVVMRVVVDRDYDRSLARPLFNCPACFEQKERSKQSARGSGFEAEGERSRAPAPRARTPVPTAPRQQPRSEPKERGVRP